MTEGSSTESTGGGWAFDRLRSTVERQLGVDRPEAAHVPLEEIVRFSPDLPAELSPDERAALAARAEELHPWLQGPFLLGGDLVVGGAWRNDQRWIGLASHVPDLTGQRVLDVGSNAGYDPFMFHLRGAAYVLACEPFEFHEQALFLESIYRTGVDFQRIGWQDVDPDRHGRFDLIHCHGVIYHEPHPIAMLQALRRMLAPGGTMLFGSMMLADAELSEHLRFVPTSYYGDPTWWFVPGRLAMRWMLEVTGFESEEEFGISEGPPGEFATINGYFKLTEAEPSALLGPELGLRQPR
jgi:SAM-dependent methyltransferase